MLEGPHLWVLSAAASGNQTAMALQWRWAELQARACSACAVQQSCGCRRSAAFHRRAIPMDSPDDSPGCRAISCGGAVRDWGRVAGVAGMPHTISCVMWCGRALWPSPWDAESWHDAACTKLTWVLLWQAGVNAGLSATRLWNHAQHQSLCPLRVCPSDGSSRTMRIALHVAAGSTGGQVSSLGRSWGGDPHRIWLCAHRPAHSQLWAHLCWYSSRSRPG